jgi:prolyl 4-hydroxylase
MSMIIEAGFVQERELIHLIHLIKKFATPTPKEGWSVDACQSSAVYLDRLEEPMVEAVYRRLVKRLGVNPATSEGFRGVVYLPGQGYRAHHDALQQPAPGEEPLFRPAGNRVITAMIYLNTIIAGGETVFPKFGVSIAPRAGTLAFWRNLDEQGAPDDRMIHLANATAAVDKFIATAWFRERALP